jgi:FdhE protein
MSAAGDGKPVDGPASIVQRLEALIGQEHVPEEYVRFRIDVLEAQWAVRRKLAETHPGASNAPGSGSSYPLLQASVVPFDAALLQTLLEALCKAAERRGAGSADASHLLDAAGSEPTLLEDVARKAAFGPAADDLGSLGRRLDVSVDGLLFFGRVLAAPFVAEAARRLERGAPLTDAADAPGHCPLCGSAPALATLDRDEGGRTLHCGLCGESWAFPRLKCPYCGVREHESLSFLRIADEDPRWIEACEDCRQYLKTVDERRLPLGPVLVPLVEDVATLHLDLLAEQDGYRRHLPYAATT